MNNIQPESEHGCWPVRAYIVRGKPAFTVCLQRDVTAAEFKAIIASKVEEYGIVDFMLIGDDIGSQIQPADLIMENSIEDVRVQQLSLPVQTRANPNAPTTSTI
ncbi:Hypp4141 [Branchiostoma lanceolatum]|uniref:Hypp4141 protein n=1 Tax=Branchiostoma lanceolatum TaxID=7740 RepID=A0A8K0A4T6_BRALA|nr:Hypp4141 [Branchiostoma lanceolatum]